MSPDPRTSAASSPAAHLGARGGDATRFAELVDRLGGDGAMARETWSSVVAAWSAPERRYHGLGHLRACLATLDEAREDAAFRDDADIAELALVYHDVVYDPRARDSEERSALRLIADARALGLSPACVEAAAACVRATAHMAGAGAVKVVEQLVIDVDLAILGSESSEFATYEAAVRAEYAHVAGVAFAIGRGRFLAELLRRPSLFGTPFFRERFEARARANIAATLATPAYAPHRCARLFAF